MAKKNIYLISLGMVFFVAVAVAAYFGTQAIQKDGYQQMDGRFSDRRGSIRSASPKGENQSESQKIVAEYPLERGMTGVLKSADIARAEIVISGDKDQRVAIVATTEIFHNGKRAALADIKDTDRVTVLGREKTKDSATLIADSIYANTDSEISVSVPE